MSKPQVIIVPPNAGIGTTPAVQIPIIGGVVTLLNLNTTLGLTLCTDQNFSPNTTWPLPPNVSIPHTDINNLWAQNSSTSTIQVLVLQGIIPVTYVPTTGAQNLTVSGNNPIIITPTPASFQNYNLQPIPSGYITLTLTIQILTVSSPPVGFGVNIWNGANTTTIGDISWPTTPVVGQQYTGEISFDGTTNASVNTEASANGYTFEVLTATASASTIAISNAPPQATAQTITYQITSTGTGTAPITDSAGNVLGHINLNQAPGTYTTTVPIVVTGSASTINNSTTSLKVISVYSHTTFVTPL